MTYLAPDGHQNRKEGGVLVCVSLGRHKRDRYRVGPRPQQGLADRKDVPLEHVVAISNLHAVDEHRRYRVQSIADY